MSNFVRKTSKQNAFNRKEFLRFLGLAGAGMALAPPFLVGCGDSPEVEGITALPEETLDRLKAVLLEGLSPSDKDELLLAKGLEYRQLIKWGDRISDKDTFGFNNDFTCFIPLDEDPNDGLLWVNHEYVHPLFVSRFEGSTMAELAEQRTKENIDREMYNVGGSIVRIRKENDVWKVVENDPLNRRISGHTPFELNWDHPINGQRKAIGTNSNCSGGITPWNTFISCEENYADCFGETVYDADNKPSHVPGGYGWSKYYDYPAEHYGWVIEVEPTTGKATKHIALGRFAHECCTLVELKDKRVVAYTGDDKSDEHLYKFISAEPGSLKNGTLYVANVERGEWLALDYDSQPDLQARFKDQTEVLIRAREAAKILGATPLNRPEDIEIDPISGNVFVSLTNNKEKGDFHGSILKIEEEGNAYDALSFSASVYRAGGEEGGFSCPDNMAFDHAGNLWITTDMSGSAMNIPDGEYMPFRNNGLFVIPRHGEDAGKVFQVASAPRDAEFTGPWFSPDGSTLFLSVQHPGEQSEHPTTHRAPPVPGRVMRMGSPSLP